jgi:oligopeptide/dipeptide ABC transporter ATP-binding protein
MNGRPSAPLLSVRGLTVEFRQPGGPPLTAVRKVSLDIPAGGVVALVGESGSGKTSLAQAILRLVPAAAGQVLFRGEDILAMDRPALQKTRRAVQAVFQDPSASLSPRRRVLQTLVEPLEQFGIGDRGSRAQMAAEALAEVELDASLLTRYPHELSGGQRQRVALARALVSGPELVVADEPFSSLDVSLQTRLVELVRQIRRQRGVAFLFVSHDLAVVRRLADSVAVFYAGRLLETGATRRIFTAPAHPYTRALLAAIPVADPGLPPPRILPGETPSPLTPPPGCVFHNRCPEASEICALEAPKERSLPGTPDEEPEHRVTCHLHND